jgi:hypothetical protein
MCLWSIFLFEVNGGFQFFDSGAQVLINGIDLEILEESGFPWVKIRSRKFRE